MPQTTFAGHPLHPQLIAAPLGLLPFSTVLDALHLATGDESYADAAHYTLVGGLVGGLAAAAAGTMDYLTIPAQTKSRKVANIHGALNLGVMGLFGANLLLRRQRRGGVGHLLMSLAGTAGLITSSWYGGELVYELGMRAKPAQEGEPEAELKLPGDRKLEQAFRQVEKQRTPGNGAKG